VGLNPWRSKDPAIPLGAREILRVCVGLIALAVLCSWPQLSDPGRLTDLDPGAFRRLTMLDDAGTMSEMPLFAREVLWTVPGRMLIERGGLSTEYAGLMLTLIGSFATGLVVWLLLRWLTRAPLASFAAAAILVVQPWRTTSLGDPALTWLFGPALAFLGIVWITRGGGWVAGLVAGMGAALAGYTSFAQLPPVVLGCAMLLLAHIPLIFRPFPAGERVSLRRLSLGLVAAVGSGIGLLWPAWREGLPAAPPGAGTSAAGWFAQDGRMQFLGIEATPGGAHYYWPVFLGWFLLFVLVWIALNVRDPRLRPWWLMALFGFFLMQGSTLHIMGRELPQVMMPHAWLADLPGFDRLPGPSAWLPFFGLALAGVLALGLKEWQVQHGRTTTFLIAALSALELRPMPLPDHKLQPPSVYARMTRAAEGSVLELPLDSGNALALWHAKSTHGRPVLFAPILAGATADPLSSAPPGLIEALSPQDPELIPAGGVPADAAVRRLRDTAGAEVEEWRRWLVEDAQVRWVVFRHAPDFSLGTARLEHPTWTDNFKRGLTPWYFNKQVLTDRHQSARELSAEYKDLAERSSTAHALLEHWFGRPDSRSGSAHAEVWQVKPAASVPPEIGPAPASSNR
jgi:hypothetical protein